MKQTNKEAVKFWVPIIAVMITTIALALTVAERVRINSAVYARNPNVEFLPPFALPKGDLFTIVVPIRNSSTSELAIAHKVHVTFTFDSDNPIREIDPGPFRLVDGGNGDHSVSLETNILYPLSVAYPSVTVREKEIPMITISWTEQTGYQSIPLVR